MELRHLRYFVAVAEAGSLTLAASRRLHTAQPSLSRQIRDLEREVGTALFSRGARGIGLTDAGRAFLDHARLALAQVEAARTAARRAAQPAKTSFVIGFLTGFEMEWLPAAMRLLRNELPRVEVVISSRTSPELATALVEGTVDVAFLRPEARMPALAYTKLMAEPLMVVLPSDHPLAACSVIEPRHLAGERFISVSHTAPVLRVVIDAWRRTHGLPPTPDHEADNLSMAISLVASTRGVALLPSYAQNFLPWSVIGRPLAGAAPTIDLVLGYRNDDASPLVRLFVARVDELVAGVPSAAGGAAS
jgi:LysR family transcriptional regulator, hca operon transcriptional activator